MMRIRRMEGGRRQNLCLAADSMNPEEWRDLRRILLQQPTPTKH